MRLIFPPIPSKSPRLSYTSLMLLFLLTTFILIILIKVLTATANWAFTHPWCFNQFRAADCPTQCSICFLSPSKSVCSCLTQPERWFPVHLFNSDQDKSWATFSTHSANPKQSQPGVTSKQDRHPMQPMPSARPKMPVISLHPHQAKPHTDHSPSNQPAPSSIIPTQCGMVLFSDMPLSPYHSITNTSCSLVTAHAPWQPYNHTAQPKDCFLAPKDFYLASRDWCLAQIELNLASSRTITFRMPTGGFYSPSAILL